MRKQWVTLALIILASGCIIPPPEKPVQGEISAEEITTTTTSTTTTTTHKILPILPLDGLITTTSTSTSTSTTTTTTTTSTTVTILLKRREYTPYENKSFYLIDIESIEGTTYYTMTYNTTDGQWGKTKFTNTTLIDDLEIGVYHANPTTLTLIIYIKENENLIDRSPKGSTIMTLGGGLTNRSFGDYRISLDSLQSNRVKLWVGRDNKTTLLQLSIGDIAYYDELEIGTLETRLPGGQTAIYLIQSTDEFDHNGGQRYCEQISARYPNATSITLNAETNSTQGAITLKVASIGDGIVTLEVSKEEFRHDFDLSCGATMDLFGRKYNLIWYGSAHKGSAKIVSHS